MNVDRMFLDANILVYAHDRSEPNKRAIAVEILQACWESPVPPSLSIQVLQETHVTLIRKGLSPKVSSDTVRPFLVWNVVENRKAQFLDALLMQQTFQLSFWDASILAAAKAAEASELWSEDFQPGRNYNGIRVVNPFA
jgi:predicted nucleic acid-binding protein